MLWSALQWGYIIITMIAILVLLWRHGVGGSHEIIMFIPGFYLIITLYREIDGYVANVVREEIEN
jgi:hypothetical protein